MFYEACYMFRSNSPEIFLRFRISYDPYNTTQTKKPEMGFLLEWFYFVSLRNWEFAELCLNEPQHDKCE